MAERVYPSSQAAERKGDPGPSVDPRADVVPLEDRAVCVFCGVGVAFDEDGCCAQCGNGVASVGEFRALLAAEGLTIVPTADVPSPGERKVLEVMAAATDRDLARGHRGDWASPVLTAELARRGGAK